MHTIGNFPRRTPTGDLQVALKIPQVDDFITKLCMHQAEAIQNHERKKLATMDKENPNTENIRGLNLAAVNVRAMI